MRIKSILQLLVLAFIIYLFFYNPENISLINQESTKDIKFLSINTIASILFYMFGKIFILPPIIILIYLNKKQFRLCSRHYFYSLIFTSGILHYLKINGGSSGLIINNFSSNLFDENISGLFLYTLLVCSIIILFHAYIPKIIKPIIIIFNKIKVISNIVKDKFKYLYNIVKEKAYYIN